MLQSDETHHFKTPQREADQKEERRVYDRLLLDTAADLGRSSYFVATMLEDGCDPSTPAPATAGHAAAAGGQEG